ncbi:uncharacterized protein [Halyomorpha halys]|uniref:uncharacterized protein isoform X1 n=1 Tax=Halyomorpha halys TaxID=286706 RepID=UPI0006D5015C|nr:uncharacterized protein LOC106683843 [Halyomorpha halys]
MDLEADKEVTPDSLEDMVRSLKEGYQVNKRLLYRLEQMLHMSKLPSTVRHFATVVREFFDDVMKSVLDMMGMVTELLKEYSHLIQVHYGMQMGEELRRVKDIFLLLEPQKYQPYIGMMVRDSCKIAMAATSGRRTISVDYGTALIRNNLYLAKVTMRVYVREARHAKRKLHKVIKSLENNWQVCTGLYWAIFKEIFAEVL